MAAKRAQILSFDQVKRSGRTSSYAGRSVRQTSQPIYIDSADAYSARRRNSVVANLERSTVRSTRSINPSAKPSEKASKRSQARAAKESSRPAKQTTANSRSRSNSSSQSRAAVTSVDSSKSSRVTKAEERKRARAKKRADKKFNKEFGVLDEARNEAAARNGSRPAVYKTEMGASQKKASRMQNAAAVKQGKRLSAPSVQNVSFSGIFEAFSHSTKAITIAAVAACLALTCVFLYPTAQTYYHTVRENDRLQAEYSALQERNTQLEANVSSLQSEAGIEARAHDQLGWVKKGEQSVTVSGLENVSDASSSTSSSLVASVDSSEIQAPSTWYSPMLDLIFGVS